jgi:hypothetical protein
LAVDAQGVVAKEVEKEVTQQLAQKCEKMLGARRRSRHAIGDIVESEDWPFARSALGDVGLSGAVSAVQDLDDGRPIEANIQQGLNTVQ